MAARHIGIAEVEDEAGRIHTVYQFENVITTRLMSGTQTTGGSADWEFPNGRPLNTDDDRNFTDLDNRVFRLVSP